MRNSPSKLLTIALIVTGMSLSTVRAQFTMTHVPTTGTPGTVTPGAAPGAYTIDAGGGDIWDTADDFDFYYMPQTGDFDVRVHLVSLEPTARWAKAGIMVRETLDADSRMAFVRVTPSGPTSNGSTGRGDFMLAYRTWQTVNGSNGGQHEDTVVPGDDGSTPAYPAYSWLRLQRVGAMIHAYGSSNGVDWIGPTSVDTSGWLVPVGGTPTPLAADGFLGLAVSPHPSADPANNICTAVFEEFFQAPLSIVTQPSDQTGVETKTATFTVEVDGDYNLVQWQRDGVDIPGANSTVYVTPPLTVADNGAVFTCMVQNTVTGASVSSAGATLTVVQDTEPPTVVSAIAVGAPPTTVILKYSEAVTAGTADDPFNYVLSNGDSFGSGVLEADEQTVTMTLLGFATFTNGTVITINNVTDKAGNMIAPDTQVVALVVEGRVRWLKWGGIGGTAVANLTDNKRFPFFPDSCEFLTSFHQAVNQDDNFGAQFLGLLIPQETASYDFYISADDNAELWLSTDDTPANKVLIAREPQWNGDRDFAGTARRPALENRSTTLFPDGIPLVAGQQYYIEALMKEGGGGDNCSVAWAKHGDAIPSTEIPGDFLSAYTAAPELEATMPADVTLLEARTARFEASVLAGTPCFNFQWEEVGVGPIADATNFSLSIGPVTTADSGRQFFFVASNDAGSVTSRVATLTVQADLDPPVVVSASSLNETNVGICFDEEVTAATAQDPFNYTVTVNGAILLVNQAILRYDQRSVELIIDASTPIGPMGTPFTVEVSGIEDLVGNVMITPGAASGTVQGFYPADVGGPAAQGSSFTCKDGDFEVAGGGADVWGTVDNFHFAYREVSGDFDFAVLVAKVDNTGPSAKGGFMVRETLDPSSRNLVAIVMPPPEPLEGENIYGVTGRNIYEAGHREQNGGGSSGWGIPEVGGANGNIPATHPNSWVRMRRVGNLFSAFASTNGQDWLKFAEIEQDYPDTVLFGLMASSVTGNPDLGRLNRVIFRHFAPWEYTGCSIAIVQQPQSQTVPENLKATFSAAVEATGVPAGEVFYQWQRSDDGGVSWVDIPGATSTNYTTDFLTVAADDQAQFRMIAKSSGCSATSDPAVLTVVLDDVPPVVVDIRGTRNPTNFVVTFSERVDALTGSDPFNYLVDGGAFTTVNAALDGSGTQVIVSVDPPLDFGASYSVDINGVRDLVGNLMAPTNLTLQTFVVSPCFALQELWFNIGGVNVGDLTSDPRYPDAPDQVDYVTLLEGPLDAFDNYGTRISGFLKPPVSGAYNFWMSSDDGGEFWLSTNDSPANLVLIASEPQWNASRDYRGTARRTAGAPENASSTLFPGGIPLEAGQLYYFQLLAKEGGGGDNCSVAWQMPGGAEPQNGDLPIPGKYMATLADPVGVVLNITQQPSDQTVTVPTGTLGLVDFSSGASGFWVENVGPAIDPWEFDGANSQWVTQGAIDACGTPWASMLHTPPLVVPQDGTVTLSFSHRYSFEDQYDGGQVQMSVNGGPWTTVDGFTDNGYTWLSLIGNHVLQNQPGFNGTSAGYANGDLITSVVALGPFSAGDRVEVRFVGAWDECTTGSRPNWVIDSVQLDPPLQIGGALDAAVFEVGLDVTVPGFDPAPMLVQWERSDDGGASWAEIAGATAPIYSLHGATASDDGAMFRATICVPGLADKALSDPATLTVVSVPTGPMVSIERTGGDVTLSWPAPSTGYVLEEATELAVPVSATVWTAVSTPPTEVGGKLTVTVPASGAQKYYRLRKP